MFYFLIFLILRSICWNNTQQHTTFHLDLRLCTFSHCTTFSKRKRWCNCITLLLYIIKRGAHTLSEVFRAGRLLLTFKKNCKLLIYEHFSQFLKMSFYTWRRTEELCVTLLWWSYRWRCIQSSVLVHHSSKPSRSVCNQQTSPVLAPCFSNRSFEITVSFSFFSSVYCTASGTRLEK